MGGKVTELLVSSLSLCSSAVKVFTSILHELHFTYFLVTISLISHRNWGYWSDQLHLSHLCRKNLEDYKFPGSTVPSAVAIEWLCVPTLTSYIIILYYFYSPLKKYSFWVFVRLCVLCCSWSNFSLGLVYPNPSVSGCFLGPEMLWYYSCETLWLVQRGMHSLT